MTQRSARFAFLRETRNSITLRLNEIRQNYSSRLAETEIWCVFFIKKNWVSRVRAIAICWLVSCSFYLIREMFSNFSFLLRLSLDDVTKALVVWRFNTSATDDISLKYKITRFWNKIKRKFCVSSFVDNNKRCAKIERMYFDTSNEFLIIKMFHYIMKDSLKLAKNKQYLNDRRWMTNNCAS